MNHRHRAAATLAATLAGAAPSLAQGLLAADPAGGRVLEFTLNRGPATRVLFAGAPLVEPVALCHGRHWDEVLVLDRAAAAVHRLDRTSGAFLGTLVPPGLGGLASPVDMAPDAWSPSELLVLNGEDGGVRRFDMDSGRFLGLAVPGRGPASAMRARDASWPQRRTVVEIAYVNAGEVLAFDAATGQLIEVRARDLQSPAALGGQWYASVVVEDRPFLPDRVFILDAPPQPPRVVGELPAGASARDVLCCSFDRIHVSTAHGVAIFDSWRGGPMTGWFAPSPGHTLAGLLSGGACYPDCDTNSGIGVLDVFDFLCFQNRFDRGAPYACDCDTSTGAGVCDIFDFLCFQNAWVFGCP